MLPIHTLEVLMLHDLMKSQPLTHFFFVHLQHQVSKQRTEKFRAQKHLILQWFRKDYVLRSSSKWSISCFQMVKDTTQRVHIRYLIRCFVVNALRSHVIRCSNIVLKWLSTLQTISWALDIRTGEIFSCSKVNQLYLELIVEKYVLRLEVTMHDIVLIVQGINCLDDMGCIVLEDGLSNNAVEFRMVPKLAISRAFHL